MCGPHRIPRMSTLQSFVPPFEFTISLHTNTIVCGRSWEHFVPQMPSCDQGLSAKLHVLPVQYTALPPSILVPWPLLHTLAYDNTVLLQPYCHTLTWISNLSVILGPYVWGTQAMISNICVTIIPWVNPWVNYLEGLFKWRKWGKLGQEKKRKGNLSARILFSLFKISSPQLPWVDVFKWIPGCACYDLICLPHISEDIHDGKVPYPDPLQAIFVPSRCLCPSWKFVLCTTI